MTDHPPPDHPDRRPVEERLRATLRTVADQGPVDDDPEELRRRAHGRAIDVPLEPGRARRRAQVLVAAAVAVVLGAVGLVALRSGDDPEQSLTTDRPAATGWYLPQGLGTDWDLVDVTASRDYNEEGVVRRVRFEGPSAQGEERRYVLVTEYVVDPPPAISADPTAAPPSGLARVDRTLLTPAEPPAEGQTLVAPDRDHLLVVHGNRVTRDELVNVIEGWWISAGEEIRPPAGTDLFRVSDTTTATASPTTISSAPTTGVDTSRPVGAAVQVTVRQRSTDTVLRYLLAPPEGAQRPTGTGLPDAGARAGLAPAERPERLELPEAPGAVWRASDVEAPDGYGALPRYLVGLFPAAQVTIGGDDEEVDAAPGVTPGRTTEIETSEAALASSLRPVSSEEWAGAVRSIVEDPDPAVLAASLADAPVPEEGRHETTGTTMPAATTTEGDGPAGPTATTTTAAGVPGAAPRVAGPGEGADALLSFADDPTDASFAALPLAATVTIGVDPTQDVPTQRQTRAALRDPDAWLVDLNGAYGRDGTASALDILGDAGDSATSVPGTMAPACPQPRGGADPEVATITGSNADGCADWFGIALRVVDGQITEVRLALHEP